MEPLLARYLDGELTEAEAAALLERAETDPRVARALSAYERVLDAARALPAATVPPGFADRVLQRVTQASAPAGLPPAGLSLWSRLRGLAVGGRMWAPTAAAAGLALAIFAVGIVAGRLALPPDRQASKAPTGEPGVHRAVPAETAHTLLAGTPWIAAAAGDDQRLVRLVYVPRRGDVARVTVAGSFNNWDPDALEMQRTGGVFVAVISLPPGAYEYMFVEDSQHWVTDPLALQTRDDGFGNANAVLDLTI